MRIYDNLPSLTVYEAQRFWMTPDTVLAAALLHRSPEARKFFANVTNRGLIPFRRFDNKRTSPRHYNLAAPIMARLMWEMVRRGRTYEFAAVGARDAATALFDAVADFDTIGDFASAFPWKVIFVSQASPLASAIAKTMSAPEVTAEAIADFAWFTCEAIPIHGLIYQTLNSYAGVWHSARDKGDAE